ncbi:membrane protein insertase YidC [Bacteroidia bacterium]|nr:membrane protein insertase YidC [Bacteroidia bacterium]
MERSSTIGYVLIVFLFFGFYYFNKQNQEELQGQKDAAEAVATKDSINTSSDNTVDYVAPPQMESVIDSNNVITSEEERITSLENELISIDFTSLGGIPKKVRLKEYKRYDSSALVLFEDNQMKLGYSIPMVNGTVLNTLTQNCETIKIGDNSVEMITTLSNDAKIIQTYTVEPNSYLIGYNVQFEGLRDIVSPNNRYAELDWSTVVQGQEKTLKDERIASTVYFKYSVEDGVDYLSETSSDEDELDANVKWVSFKQKFFNQTLINKAQFVEKGTIIESIDPGEDADHIKNMSAKFFIPLEQNSVIEDMSLYYGPNHYQTLKGEDLGLEKMIPLGWGIFGWVNKGIVIPLFNWLDKYFTSYGLIILLLTLIIKTALFFPMFKVYKSTAKMKLLKPELDEIKERTGGDMQKAQQEQMKLYKQAGVSPLGGCLPQLVQMPILFAMFRFFPASIELRQEKLWWANDLSSYDSIFNFPNGFEIPFYGDHVSLFTLMMTAVTILYTYMNSQNSGQMVGPMKTVMYIMPIMFLGFFNNYAAALSFYYFLSTCITIIQNFVIRKFVIDEDKLHKQIQDSKKKKVNVKKSGLQKRLEDMAKKRGVDPRTGKPVSTSNPKTKPKSNNRKKK